MFVRMKLCIWPMKHAENFHKFFLCVYSHRGVRNKSITVFLIYIVKNKNPTRNGNTNMSLYFAFLL